MHSFVFGLFFIGGLTFLCYIVYITLMKMVQDKVAKGGSIIDGVEIDLYSMKGEEVEILSPGLYIWSGTNDKNDMITDEPTIEIIETAVRLHDWTNITFITLVFSGGNYIEVSGAESDGFSVSYKQGDTEMIANVPPQSIQEISDILCGFLKNKEGAVIQYGFS